jgi:hypothetical protein
VITIQSAMLALLGFLVAILLVLLLAPAYWRRAVRLTTERIKQSMPLTEAEIRADKDRLRAEYAIKIHRLEAKAEQSTLDSARQQIELNRRDAAISSLEGEIARLKTSLDEYENAHRVLEQTITDRMPRLEQKLGETTGLLAQRDRELATVTDTATRNGKSLEEAVQLNAQQRNEVMKLNSALAALSARTREGLADPKFDAEVALRTELEEARGRLAEQAALIERMKAAGGGAQTAAPSSLRIAEGLDRSAAEKELSLARNELEAAQRLKAELETQFAAARRTIEDQSVEIASTKAALAAYERGSGEERSISLKDSRLAMKVRIGALQAESEKQSAAIQRMRGELAAANERLAKQASHFMAEMRRLGSGAGLMPPSGKVPAEQRRVDMGETAAKPSLGPRLANLARPLRAVTAAVGGDPKDAGQSDGQDASRVRGFLKALGGAAAVRAGSAAGGSSAIPPSRADEPLADDAGAVDASRHGAAAQRLSERITSITKS